MDWLPHALFQPHQPVNYFWKNAQIQERTSNKAIRAKPVQFIKGQESEVVRFDCPYPEDRRDWKVHVELGEFKAVWTRTNQEG